MSKRMYVAERIVNIADLEEHILNAYTMNQLAIKEFSDLASNMKHIKGLLEAMNRELESANDFEFRIEQRKVISEVC